MSSSHLSELAGVIGMFILITTVVTVTIWQVATTRRLKAQLAHAEPFQRLATEAAHRERETGRQLTELGGQLSDVQKRLTALEELLKDVE